MSLILILPILVTGLAYWSVLSVRIARGEATSPTTFCGALIAGLVGASVLLCAALLGGGLNKEVHLLILGFFGAVLFICAWTDHQTAYAPDGLILPLLFGAAYLPHPERSGLAIEVWPALVVIGMFLAAQAAWRLQVWAGTLFLTPPDSLVLLLPVLVFGLTPISWAIYLLMCVPLAALLNAPDPIYRAVRGPAAEAAAREVGFEADGRSAPLLPISLGALGVVIAYVLFEG